MTCIGVDARLCLCFSGRNLGAIFEVLCVGLNIMNLKLFDAYCIINSRIITVTLGYRIDSLDICFGSQLADSRGDIGVIYA